MNCFYDTEFIERPGSIQLVSIGIVRADGKTYYAIHRDFDVADADPWVVSNVLSRLEPHLARKSLEQIKLDILHFMDGVTPRWVGYYSAYDHVVLSWIFGRMIELPKGWPMYTYDIKQLSDDLGISKIPIPQPPNAHNALADAMWVRDAYNYLIAQVTADEREEMD